MVVPGSGAEGPAPRLRRKKDCGGPAAKWGGMAMGKGEELYRRYRNGDESGFDGVMDLYRENLIFFLLRYLPRIEDAEDAAEDAFVALLSHPYRENRGASLKTYLFTLGRNRAATLLKQQKRRAELERPENLCNPGDGGDAAALEDRLCRDETRRELLRALDRISPGYREALYLLYFEGLSLEETARVMKKSKKQIENLSYRGKKALREILGKESESL